MQFILGEGLNKLNIVWISDIWKTYFMPVGCQNLVGENVHQWRMRGSQDWTEEHPFIVYIYKALYRWTSRRNIFRKPPSLSFSEFWMKLTKTKTEAGIFMIKAPTRRMEILVRSRLLVPILMLYLCYSERSYQKVVLAAAFKIIDIWSFIVV